MLTCTGQDEPPLLDKVCKRVKVAMREVLVATYSVGGVVAAAAAAGANSSSSININSTVYGSRLGPSSPKSLVVPH